MSLNPSIICPIALPPKKTLSKNIKNKKMIQTLNIPYSSKTDEIMSRYRPIAPKPEILPPNNSTTNKNGSTNSFDAPLVPEKFRQSPYLRNMWSHLQARPTRTRKRGRGSAMSPAAAAALLRKQQQEQHQQQQQQQSVHSSLGMRGATTTFMGLCSPTQAFGLYADHQLKNRNNINVTNNINNSNNNNNNNNGVVELPLLSCPMLSPGNKSKAIDLNLEITTLEERDLLQLQLQVVPTITPNRVISPRPIRPVGSSIRIISPISDNPAARVITKAPDEVEAGVEAEALPVVISDRSNKVRMVNSAYKELVGQPECPWLDTMCTGGGRISGEVMLQYSGSGLPVSSKGFSCWVKIEWESEGKKKSVNAFCDVVKMVCLLKDYVLYWRFNTKEFSN